MRLLRIAGWIAATMYAIVPSYWLVVHPRPQFWRKYARTGLRAAGPIWFGMWLAAVLITWPWRQIVLYSTPWSWLGAAPLFAATALLYVLGGRNFTTDQVLGRAELQPETHEQRLETSGIRGRMRHPYYLGHLLHMLAWSVGTGLAVSYALSAYAVITGVFMIRAEERELEQRFGEQYRTYRQRVPAMLPSFRK